VGEEYHFWAQSIMFVGAEYFVCGLRVFCLWAQSIMFVGAEYHVCGRRVSCLWAQSITFVGAKYPRAVHMSIAVHTHPTTTPQTSKDSEATTNQAPAALSVLFQLPDPVATSQLISCDLIFSLKFH